MRAVAHRAAARRRTGDAALREQVHADLLVREEDLVVVHAVAPEQGRPLRRAEVAEVLLSVSQPDSATQALELLVVAVGGVERDGAALREASDDNSLRSHAAGLELRDLRLHGFDALQDARGRPSRRGRWANRRDRTSPASSRRR